MKDTKVKANLDHTEKGIKDMVADGSMQKDELYKFLIVFAHDHMLNDDFASAQACIKQLPDSYLDGEMLEQMNKPDEFVNVAYRLAEMLVGTGAVSLEQQFYFTKAPAKA